MTEDRDALYCKIYVDAEVAPHDLVALLATESRAVAENLTLDEATWALDLRRNEDCDSLRVRRDEDGFVYARYYLDVIAKADQTREAHSDLVSSILVALWSHGFTAVAAADFEDDLPNRGGYRPCSPRQ